LSILLLNSSLAFFAAITASEYFCAANAARFSTVVKPSQVAKSASSNFTL